MRLEGRRGRNFLNLLLDHHVHKAVAFRFFCRHVIVAFDISLNLLEGLPGMFGQQFIQAIFHPQGFLRLNGNIGCLTAHPPPPKAGES